jgi:hypothetical protein
MKDKKRTAKNIITIETKAGIVCLNGYASQSAHLYVELILEACARRKIDARDAIINTDSYPVLNKTSDVEFAIGWLHGVAEAHELLAEQIFDAMIEPLVTTRKSPSIAGKKRPAQKVTPTKRGATA